MKKIAIWGAVLAGLVFVIDWGIMGLKLMDGDYDITVQAYIGLACLIVILICAVCKLLGSKCPHCGKLLYGREKFCPHCGEKIGEEKKR